MLQLHCRDGADVDCGGAQSSVASPSTRVTASDGVGDRGTRSSRQRSAALPQISRGGFLRRMVGRVNGLLGSALPEPLTLI